MGEVKSMYVHIPFCKSICSYCDFTKVFYSFLYEEKYLDSLEEEIKKDNPNKCNTIYIGGGTPSVLSNHGLERLLKLVSSYLEKDYEFTIEVNPETIDEDKIRLFKKYGINRVSIGVESFSDEMLRILSRKHNFDDVKRCVDLLNKYGIDNYSFDFIYGIRGLKLIHIENDFKYIDILKPKHLSFYSLILENNTCLKAQKYVEEDEEIIIEEYDYIFKELEKRGFNQYEVSNYSLKGYESRHNLVYWNARQYYGFGLGASGYVNGIRYVNTKNLTKYLNGENKREEEILTKEDLKEEYLMLKLRLNEGISLDEYRNLFDEDLLITKKKEIESLLDTNLIKFEGNRLTSTYKGMLLLDMIIVSLI